ncbi:MAG TPA: NAD-dependent epimerase/dehydratase family protein [Acidimicrobiia bacterium]|nr:NAD-dependent epimerase/dehydratase family protein [Acidimicrobiia bacterium]
MATPEAREAPAGMRVLVTGVGTFWGGRVAQIIEQDPNVEVVVGLDTRAPTVPLERTEVVRADSSYSILSRLVRATEVDTILHSHLEVDSTTIGSRALHETNVIGTMNLLAAAGAPGSSVRKVVLKSSTLVYGSHPKDPYFFSEDAARSGPARTRVERSLLEVAGYIADFADDHPDVVVTRLRFSNVLGPDLDTPLSRALRLPVVPEIFGFDPRLQFTHQDDVLGALCFTARHDVPGIYNVAGDGTLPWSDVARIVGRRRVPISPLGTGLAAGALRRLGIVDLPLEVQSLLRFGRGVDNRRLQEAGYRYRFTSAGTVEDFARSVRLRSAVGERPSPYRYDPGVEDFFRRSPAVVSPPSPRGRPRTDRRPPTAG